LYFIGSFLKKEAIMSRKKVLIIDDEKDFCTLAKMHLTAISEFDVHMAFNGQDGFKLAKKIRPDIIVLDLVMPGVDGFEVLEMLKKDCETLEIPVIMLTAREDTVLKKKALELYNEAYLVKPVEVKELKEKIEEIFKLRKII